MNKVSYDLEVEARYRGGAIIEGLIKLGIALEVEQTMQIKK